ncbi:serine protease persephone isoform X2 [Solenopsis invicta]|uniref:serine protease persephone isoform X2 n=1 Tax=Solenopsis invicta TaxID=13686 RepID=UPI00193E7B97|nr:serine protease persephone isoform X2 [Solenopsis invicta]
MMTIPDHIRIAWRQLRQSSPVESRVVSSLEPRASSRVKSTMCVCNVINRRVFKMDFNLSFSILIVLLFRFFTHSLPLQEELYGSHCKMENGETGVCKKLYECPSRLQEVKEGRRSSDSMGRCGFEDFTEIVCCQFNITDKIGLRPAEIACRQYENEIGSSVKARRDTLTVEVQFNIYGGTQTENGEFPYMVALGYENEERDEDNSEAIKYNCGGTLISSQYVLTAAHCVSNIQEKVPIEVRVGSEDLKSVGDDAQRIRISNVITHPQYKRSVNYNDVAILKLSTPVRIGSNVRPICIQTKSLDSMNVQSNVTFVVIGWGATSFDEDGSTKLMKTPALSLVDRESCAKSYNGFSKLPRGLDENMLCVLDRNVTRRSDACHGDSGGPLLMFTGSSHSIVGITAFGQTCGSSTPGVYTAVYSYLEWIEKEVWSEMFNER